MLAFLRNLILLIGLIAIVTAQVGVQTGLGVGPAGAGANVNGGAGQGVNGNVGLGVNPGGATGGLLG
ncbi:Glycine-rich cell wall structural protein [Caenorhabditis elegans]|uniref:Glycine-rich cell wall structural protein n=1 Tax=Caenorhabditis elegans TaxID=6239 RepID=Q4W4Z3_CAEEL|nr:Glycine-rich cell wall structural protein [Caenorhabditis elegans]CCD70725.1 Glycine-rich cell wall structural protein [Caenorhabditis elegans]|eukprot:NP_001023235.1 Uncharacterized protein CELE_F56D6.8 [Caenorhabditis elegans]